MEKYTYTFSEKEPLRLDVFLAARLTSHSRSELSRYIKDGLVNVAGQVAKPSLKLKPGMVVEISVPPAPSPIPLAEDIPLDVLYEDENLVVINKAPGMVVHPSRGHPEGTLVNALLHCTEELSETDDESRRGIVHRLDKDTSGVILVARNNQAHSHLSQLFKDRKIEKEYIAIIHGVLPFLENIVDKPIGRSRRNPSKMAVVTGGKESYTKIVKKESWGPFSLVHAHPKTGRTHQIRVHLKSLKTPILCDPLYGKEKVLTGKDIGNPEIDVVLDRLALHAFSIRFNLYGKEMAFQAPFPADLLRAVEILRDSF